MRPPPVSRAKLARAGWARTDQRPWRSKLDARYEHLDWWRLSHCGHPTALHPWVLTDPKGRLVLTGVTGPAVRPDYGTAWTTLRQAIEWVSSLDRFEREEGPRWFSARPEVQARGEQPPRAD